MPRPTTSLVEPKLVRIRPWDFEHSLRIVESLLDVNLLEHWSCMFLACHTLHAQVENEDSAKGKAVLRILGFGLLFVLLV